MSLNYSLRDAERWAAFSGDDNPIHFDAGAARRAGLNALCVHGMRAMLDVKHALSAALVMPAAHVHSLVFSCRLREPVACGIPWQLAVSETRRHHQTAVRATLLNGATQQSAMSAKLGASDPLLLSFPDEVNRLDEDEMAGLYARFLAVGSPAAPLWCFYDAVLFRLLVHAPQMPDALRRSVPQRHATRLGDVSAQVPVVQTHHETRFPRSLLRHKQPGERFEPLHYVVLPALVTGEKQTGLVLQADIQAWCGGVPPISTTVTLKIGPLVE